MASSQPPRLLDQVREAIRLKLYSLKTEKSYIYYLQMHKARQMHEQDLATF
ncbi:MAG: hypothetical protein ACFB8W_20715 [Elainellaceae cyanobacterium]